ncbi:MAG: TldD/PmbA family protein, partial [Caldimicrobium sp.]
MLYQDLYFEKTQFFQMTLEPSGIEEISAGVDIGLGVREINEKYTNFYTYITDKILHFLEERGSHFFNGESFKEFKSKIVKAQLERPIHSGRDKYFKFLKTIEKEIPQVPEIKHYRLGLREVKKKIIFFNSQGELCETKREYLRLIAVVVAEKDGILERGYEAKGYSLSLERALELDPELYFLGKKASNLALLMLSARKAKAGVMPVVLAGEAGGTMIHEAVGHGLEADDAEEGLSVYAGKIGEKVASPLITVIDDPTLPNLY